MAFYFCNREQAGRFVRTERRKTFEVSKSCKILSQCFHVIQKFWIFMQFKHNWMIAIVPSHCGQTRGHFEFCLRTLRDHRNPNATIWHCKQCQSLVETIDNSDNQDITSLCCKKCGKQMYCSHASSNETTDA